MRPSRTSFCVWLAFVSLALAQPATVSSLEAERKAVAYLAREVPDWPRQNHCFSCHNNGDAARALYVARSLSHAGIRDALEQTTAWLLKPGEWDDAKGEPGFSDLKLARIQFAAALTEAVQTGSVRNHEALLIAGQRLAADQEEDGSWDIDVPGVLGSPATYGDLLGTYMARRALVAADAAHFQVQIARADAWFLGRNPAATLDCSAVALALAASIADAQSSENINVFAATEKLAAIHDRIAASQNNDGGWGPYPKSPSEPFDTAVALLALQARLEAQAGNGSGARESIQNGRRYLIQTQLPAGGWTATTRPAGFQSYAQHISTTGWAALALMKTSPR